ncbi:MAG: HigA family addiction module antitoxin [Deltaproteobacteria bacterium]|nr:HigA family addiction module antitoxin [Deltaproteobacteria bacterium]
MTLYVKPVSPGEILLEEFIKPLGLSQAAVARGLRVPPTRVSEIIAGKRVITPETALRLEAMFGWPAEYWLRNQVEFDLDRERGKRGEKIKAEVKRVSKTA